MALRVHPIPTHRYRDAKRCGSSRAVPPTSCNAIVSLQRHRPDDWPGPKSASFRRRDSLRRPRREVLCPGERLCLYNRPPSTSAPVNHDAIEKREDYAARLKELVNQLAEEGTVVEVDSDLVDDVGLSSIEIMELIEQLEDTYDISFPLNDLAEIRTITDMAKEL